MNNRHEEVIIIRNIKYRGFFIFASDDAHDDEVI